MALNRFRQDIVNGAFPDQKLERRYVELFLRMYQGSGDKPFVFGDKDSVEIHMMKEAKLLREVYDASIHKKLGLSGYGPHAVALQFTEKGLESAKELSEEYELIDTQPLIRRRK